MATTPTSFSSSSMANNHLDVERDDEREQRLRRLLERTDRDQSPVAGTSLSPSRPSFDFGVRETHAVEPPTQLLERIQQFLPQMEAANTELLQRAQGHPESVDIEHLDANHDGTYIEMNLGLGVFTIRRPASDQPDSDQEHATADSSSDADASDSVTDGDDSDPEDAYSTLIGNFLSNTNTASSQRPMRPLPKRARRATEVLGESGPADAPDHAHENRSPS